MSTQPGTHPDPHVPWLDLSMGVPDWLAEYKLQSGQDLKAVHANAMHGYGTSLRGQDTTMILEELIRYREAYHAARRDLGVSMGEVASVTKERDHLRNEVAALLRTAAAMESEMNPEPLIKPSASERVQLLEIDLASAYQTIEELKSERDKATRASGEFMHERDMAQRRADTLMETVKRQGESIEHMTRKVQELTDSLVYVTSERDQAWAENTTLVERTSEMCSRADGLVIRANALEAEAERLNTRIVELETTMQQGAIKLRGVVDRVQARQAPIEPWGLVRDPEDDEDDGRPVVEPFTTSREESKVRFINPVKLREDLWPPALSPEAIRNFQATVRRGPGTRTYSIHGSDDDNETAPVRPEYEHKVLPWLSEDEFRARLVEMGAQGWKLVAHQMDLQDSTHYCVFGRKS